MVRPHRNEKPSAAGSRGALSRLADQAGDERANLTAPISCSQRIDPRLLPTMKVFPDYSRDLFNTILEEENLKFDRDGRRRTAYSLRHTYICLRLMEGADIYQIAKNCRTSVEMIEKFYASHIKTRLDAAAINIMRKKKVAGKVAKELRTGT